MFKITDHLNQLQIVKRTSAKIVAICPVCGEDNLKINATTGAYSCYSNACPPSEIRSAMGVNPDNPLTNRLPPPKEVTPVIYPSPIRLREVEDYELPGTKKYYSRKYSATVIETSYYYSPTQRVKRIDRPGGKDIYPLFKEANNSEKEICGNNGFPLYNEKYLHPRLAYTCFLVEGEKAATIFTANTGWLAVSPSGGAWSERHLLTAFRRLIWQVESFIILPDNDEPGASKALLIQDCAWACGIAARILDLSEYYQKEKEDVVNLIDRGIDLKKTLAQMLKDNY